MKRLAIILLILLLIIPAYAGTSTEQPGQTEITEPTVRVIYTGPTDITLQLATTTDDTQKKQILTTATKTVFQKLKYPYIFSSTVKETFNITTFRCKEDVCAYWIEATRGGKPVATNSPYWLHVGTAGLYTVASEITDTEANEITITLQEDPRGAVEAILKREITNLPVGEATIGTQPWQVPP